MRDEPIYLPKLKGEDFFTEDKIAPVINIKKRKVFLAEIACQELVR